MFPRVYVAKIAKHRELQKFRHKMSHRHYPGTWLCQVVARFGRSALSACD